MLHFLNSSHEIKRLLLLGRKVMSNPDSIVKSRDITLPTKVWLVKAMVFPVVVYGCESWTVKKAGCQRIDAFELWCWRTLLRVLCTARRSNQSILKEINPEHSLEEMMLGAVLRWWKNRMGRPLSPPQIHQKIIWMLSKYHKTTSEHWQRTSGTQKDNPFSSKEGRTKYKRQIYLYMCVCIHYWYYV